MWFYIGIIAAAWTVYKIGRVPTPTDIVVTTKHVYTVTSQVYTAIRNTGLGVCLIWTQQVIANRISRNLVEIHHRHYIVHYPYGVTWYKIIIPRHRGPCKIDTIVDSNGKDVKKDVCSFMGPSHNFHGIKVSPGMLGYESLIFTNISGVEKIFTKDDIIDHL